MPTGVVVAWLDVGCAANDGLIGWGKPMISQLMLATISFAGAFHSLQLTLEATRRDPKVR